MEIFLHDHVAAAGESGVFVADEHGVGRGRPRGILRPVDEAQQIAIVEVAEALNFIHRRNGISQTRHELSSQLEAQIHALGADVEQQVAWGRDRMARSGANLAEGCSSAGRGCPKRRSHASEPKPMTQESPLPGREIPRRAPARRGLRRSERRVARFSGPGLSVATRKIAARVSGAATACARAGDLPAASGVFVGSGFMGVDSGSVRCLGIAVGFLQVPAKLIAHRGQKFISEVDLAATRSFSSCDDAPNVSAILSELLSAVKTHSYVHPDSLTAG